MFCSIGNNLTEIPPGGFDGLPNVEELVLSMNMLEDSSFGPSLFMVLPFLGFPFNYTNYILLQSLNSMYRPPP